MNQRPFRFVHASDFHLEEVPGGIAEIPDHLRDTLLEAPYRAAERVFEVAVSEAVEFVVLSGDLLDSHHTGVRGPLFLVEQFQRLAKQQIAVFWAPGEVDGPESWPNWLPLPGNVHLFPRAPGHSVVYRRTDAPIARLVSGGYDPSRGAGELTGEAGGLFTIAVAHGSADAQALAAGMGIAYWALGGGHTRTTLATSPATAHDPGTPQGRGPWESGPHGCTLVQVDDQARVRLTPVNTDVLRFCQVRVSVDPHTPREGLEKQFREHLKALSATAPGVDLLIEWTLAGGGPLVASLRSGTLAADLLTWLRREFGFSTPIRWSLSLEAEAGDTLPSAWYEQESLLGDFLRSVRHYQTHAEESIDLKSYVPAGNAAGTLGPAMASLANPAQRERVLREVALLGVDLLRSEESRP